MELDRSQQMAALAAMDDDEIDLSDIPEIRDWSGAVRGKFSQFVKGRVVIKVDLGGVNSQGSR